MGHGLRSLALVFVLTAALHAETDLGPPGDEPAELSRLVLGYSESVFFDVDLNDARAATKVWAEQIVRRKHPGAEVDTVIFPDHFSLQSALERKAVDIVALLTLEYLKLKDSLPLEPVMVTEVRDGVYERFLVLVRADGEVQDISSLQRRKVIVEGTRGEIPLMWLDTVLLAQGFPETRAYCASVKVTKKAADTVFPVFFKQADCCVVSYSAFETVTELNPQIGRELKAILTSPGFLVGIICYRKDFPERYRTELKETMGEMHTDPRGSQLVTLFKVKKLTPFSPSYLNSVELMQGEYNALKTRRPKSEAPLK
jgi:ABC-type phosphate/phosphonate transport system substrate-binding protein